MLPNQIQITTQTTIGFSQPAIDASVFQRPEDATGERGDGKDVEDVAVTQTISLRQRSQADLLRYVSIVGKGCALVLVCRIIKNSQGPISGLQFISVPLIGAKLDLSRRMRRQYFVEPEIELFLSELTNGRRQMNGAAVADA